MDFKTNDISKLFFFKLTGGSVGHGLESHDSGVLRDHGAVEVAETVHVLRGVLEVSATTEQSGGWARGRSFFRFMP